MKPIYLDYNATTPVDPAVYAAMKPYLEEYFGNPSSSHRFGLETKKAIILAREQVAQMLNASPGEIIFTSGGTESNNFALKGAAHAMRHRGNHLITSAIEHPSVIEVFRYLERNGFEVTYLPVDEYGLVDMRALTDAFRATTILVSVMHANNEVGTIQPVAEIGDACRTRGILFHTDAAQSVGKIPVDVQNLKVDLLTVAGHKFYAPKGIGALYVRHGVRLEKLIHGADHESNLRAGTENVIHIVGLGAAASLVTDAWNQADPGTGVKERMSVLKNRLLDGIQKSCPGTRQNGHPTVCFPNTLNISFPGVEAGLLLGAMPGVAASAGAACHTDRDEISGVLQAMGVPPDLATGSIRFSLGRYSTEEEIDEAIGIIGKTYRSLTTDEGAEKANVPAGPIVKLTGYTQSLGCACKIRPQLLERILRELPATKGKQVLVGPETSDDASVFAISDDLAIVQSVDFIPPVVDDPFMYGAIAAANALSDIYAMGGVPAFALSIVGFPDQVLPAGVLNMILKGAASKASEAGIEILGGHTIGDREPKFGLVVTGFVEPSKILRNSTARPGDVLILTKPLGSGIVTTAIKRGLASEAEAAEVMAVMAELNRKAALVINDFPVNACTDVTGFGLLGHLKEMVKGSAVTAVVHSGAVPVIKAAMKFASDAIIPGGTRNNLDFAADITVWDKNLPETTRLILADAQTSGGLLISVPEHYGVQMVVKLKEEGIPEASVIGAILEGEPAIRVVG